MLVQHRPVLGHLSRRRYPCACEGELSAAVLSIWARVCLVVLVACLCVIGLTGWAATGSMELAVAWTSSLSRVLLANPFSRATILVSGSIELWNYLAFRKVWS
jgi:hypothetical protein